MSEEPAQRVQRSPTKAAHPVLPKVLRRDNQGVREEVPMQAIRDLKIVRQKEVDDSGWASDIHKPYRPLGGPDLDRVMPIPTLISKIPKALVRQQQQAANKKGGRFQAEMRKQEGEEGTKIIIPISNRPVHIGNGWNLLTDAIAKSQSRMVGCKFGSSYPELMSRQGFMMHSQSPLKFSVSQVDLRGEISRLSQMGAPPQSAGGGRLALSQALPPAPRLGEEGGESPSGNGRMNLGEEGADGEPSSSSLQRESSGPVGVLADEAQLRSVASAIRFPAIGGLGARKDDKGRKGSPVSKKGAMATNPYMARLYDVIGEDPGENALVSVVQGVLPAPAQLRIETDPQKAVKQLLDEFKDSKERLKDSLHTTLADHNAMLGEMYVYKSLALRTDGSSAVSFSPRRWALEAERSRILERLQALDAHPWYNRLMFLLTQSHHGLTAEQEAIMAVVKDVVERGEEFLEGEMFGLMLLVPRNYHVLDAVQKIFIFMRDELGIPFDLWMNFTSTHNLSSYVNLARKEVNRSASTASRLKSTYSNARSRHDSHASTVVTNQRGRTAGGGVQAGEGDSAVGTPPWTGGGGPGIATRTSGAEPMEGGEGEGGGGGGGAEVFQMGTGGEDQGQGQMGGGGAGGGPGMMLGESPSVRGGRGVRFE